jgi:hypothetical protein
VYSVCMQCEADAVAFTEEAQRGLSLTDASDSGGAEWPAGLPWTADGSYALAPHQVAADQSKLRLESCLVRPRTGPLQAQQRTRIVHHLKRQSASGEWQIDTVEVSHPQVPISATAPAAPSSSGDTLLRQIAGERYFLSCTP